MVEPITMALMAAQAIGSGLEIVDSERQKAFNQAATEAQVENFTDLITEQKLDAARKNLAIQGAGAVAAGAAEVQVSGSTQAKISQDIFDNQLQALREIRQLKFRRTLAELQGASKASDFLSEQAGAAISGAASIGKIYQQDKAESDLKGLKE